MNMCVKCNLTFGTASNLKIHQQMVHQTLAKVVFANGKSTKVQRDSSNNNFLCPCNLYSTQCPLLLNKHAKTHNIPHDIVATNPFSTININGAMLIVCTKHSYCVWPHMVKKHLAFCHTTSIPMLQQKGIVKHFESETYQTHTQGIPVIDSAVTPFAQLTLTNGFKCTKCGYLSSSKPTMDSHCYNVHNNNNNNNSLYTSTVLQSFFP